MITYLLKGQVFLEMNNHFFLSFVQNYRYLSIHIFSISSISFVFQYLTALITLCCAFWRFRIHFSSSFAGGLRFHVNFKQHLNSLFTILLLLTVNDIFLCAIRSSKSKTDIIRLKVYILGILVPTNCSLFLVHCIFCIVRKQKQP